MRHLSGLRNEPIVTVKAQLLILSAVLATAALAAGPPERDAAARQRSKDLHRHEGGHIWVLALESRLRDRLAVLDELRRSIVTLQTAVDQRIEQNRLRWKAATVRSEALKAALAVLKPEDPTLTFERGRRAAARRVVVPALRFGRHVLENVPVWVLPPEAEDVGALIGPQAFTDCGVRLEPERLRLVIPK